MQPLVLFELPKYVLAEPPRRPVGLGFWPAKLKLIENPEYAIEIISD